MINSTTIDLVKTAITPFMVTNVISKDDVAEVLKVLKNSNRKEGEKEEKKYLTRKDLAARWKRKIVTIRSMERNGIIIADPISSGKKLFLLSKIEFYESTGFWTKS